MSAPGSWGLFEHPLNEFKSIQVTRLSHDFYDSDPKRGFYGGGGIDARFQTYPIIWALGGLPRTMPRVGQRVQADGGRLLQPVDAARGTHHVAAGSENSISLDPRVKDAWGLPAIRVTYNDHPDDLKISQFLLDRSMEILDAAGAQRKWVDYRAETATFTAHLLGTCRMGKRSEDLGGRHRPPDPRRAQSVPLRRRAAW